MDLRGAQSRSAVPALSVPQHSGLLRAPGQRGSVDARSSRGMAELTAAVAPMMAATMIEARILKLVERGTLLEVA